MTQANASRILAPIRYLLWLSAAGALLSCTALFAAHNYYADLLSNFRIQYIVLLLLPVVFSLSMRQWIVAAVTGSVLLLHSASVIPNLIPRSAADKTYSVSIKVMSANLQYSNSQVKRYVKFLKSVEPDVIVFQEYSLAWHAALSEQLAEYPYRLTAELPHAFGIGLYSKYELNSTEIIHFQGSNNPSLKASINLGETTFSVIGTHPFPPISKQLFNTRNKHLASLTDYALDQSDPIIIAGDFNVSTWSPWFQRVLKTGNLQDARKGMGVFASWPSYFFPALIPIDHILMSSDFNAVNFQASGSLGSDHRAVWAELQL